MEKKETFYLGIYGAKERLYAMGRIFADSIAPSSARYPQFVRVYGPFSARAAASRFASKKGVKLDKSLAPTRSAGWRSEREMFPRPNPARKNDIHIDIHSHNMGRSKGHNENPKRPDSSHPYGIKVEICHGGHQDHTRWFSTDSRRWGYLTLLENQMIGPITGYELLGLPDERKTRKNPSPALRTKKSARSPKKNTGGKIAVANLAPIGYTLEYYLHRYPSGKWMWVPLGTSPPSEKSFGIPKFSSDKDAFAYVKEWDGRIRFIDHDGVER